MRREYHPVASKKVICRQSISQLGLRKVIRYVKLFFDNYLFRLECVERNPGKPPFT